ncbi:MAG: hypothetical protein K940chlam8_00009 [Chlamydiae bacterium]|nr:hypothetical protein [Chlamydiota bacterium]
MEAKEAQARLTKTKQNERVLEKNHRLTIARIRNA